nr:deoxyribodipyrimidine photo-lyase isoform X1 [Parasteatoda tepidariorum]XP_042907539.1 deoxyribodipyrimidine photo-lyase isoform X2 [Parasteatoda tepidariorum]
MLKGLQEVEEECKSLNIHFHLLLGESKNVLPKFVKDNQVGGVVTDFSPLRVPQKWVSELASKLPPDVPLCQVDAHNIVPCWVASDKQEYGARTIRKKIHDKLKEYLTDFPPVVKNKLTPECKFKPVDWNSVEEILEVNMDVDEVKWAIPGTTAGLKQLSSFCKDRLKHFHDCRNDPTKNNLSNLSPWFHFGQLSIQRTILVVSKLRSKYPASVDAFVEEAVIRRELSDNFCFYNKKYDQVDGAYDWAKKTLKDHSKDKREYIYTKEQFENAKTHDLLWNAAQRQLKKEGKMHGFLRMYWAKKILEWTNSPEEALEFAIYFNDKYNLDGRDPNGYVGCMWSICGIHDQGWAERAVFGKIRFMNFKGCQRKFDVNAFIQRYREK